MSNKGKLFLYIVPTLYNEYAIYNQKKNPIFKTYSFYDRLVFLHMKIVVYESLCILHIKLIR